MEILHVIEPNCQIHKQFHSIVIKKQGKKLRDIPINNLKTIIVYGYNQVTTQVIHQMAERGINIVFASLSGSMKAMIMTTKSNNVILRLAQYSAWKDPTKSLHISRKLIESKVQGQIAVLQQHKKKLPINVYEDILRTMNQQLDAVTKVNNTNQLFGIEGASAKAYFSGFDSLLINHRFEHRERRPAYDPVNALLNLTYMTLLRSVFLDLEANGFDSELGFMHGIRYGRESLALDCVEPLRPFADIFVIKLLNTKQIKTDMFVTTEEDGCRLGEDGFKKYMQLYHKHFIDGDLIMLHEEIEKQTHYLKKYLLEEKTFKAILPYIAK